MKIRKINKSNGNRGIAETLIEMRQLVIDSDGHRIVKEQAKRIIQGCAPDDELCHIQCAFDWVQAHMKYVRDIYGVEEVTAPHIIIESILNERDYHSADCDDFAVLLSALLRSIGLRTRLEAVALKDKSRFDHARASVFINAEKRWMALEGTKAEANLGYRFKSKRPIMYLEC